MAKNNPQNPSEKGATAHQPPKAAKERRTWAINRFALVTAGFTFVLIVLGSLVTNNDAGNVLPSWPLSLGSLLPGRDMTGLAVYEYLHRIVAGLTGLLVVALFIWILIGERRGWVKWVAALAVVLVAAQAWLGALRLISSEVSVMALIHAFAAQVFLGVIISLTVFTSPGWVRAGELRAGFRKAPTPSVFFITTAATAALLLQVLLGAAYSHDLVGVVPHVAGAVVTSGLIVWGVVLIVRLEHERDRTFPYLTRPARTGLWILVLELLLGVLAFLFGAGYIGSQAEPQRLVITAVIHTGFASALLVTEVMLLIRLYRMVPITEHVQ